MHGDNGEGQPIDGLQFAREFVEDDNELMHLLLAVVRRGGVHRQHAVVQVVRHGHVCRKAVARG